MLAERKLQNVSSATFREHFATRAEYDKVKQLFGQPPRHQDTKSRPARHLPAMLRNARRAGRSRSVEFPNCGTRRQAGMSFTHLSEVEEVIICELKVVDEGY